MRVSLSFIIGHDAERGRSLRSRPGWGYHRWVRNNRGGFTQGITSIVLGLLAVNACGDSQFTQPEARDQAADAVCDFQTRCGQIGAPPATYGTRDDCLTMSKGTIQGLWPAAECTKIVKAEFDACIIAIKNGTCGDLLDFLATLSKCAKANVCGTS
jgi:Family of unknown function (DUF6184)